MTLSRDGDYNRFVIYRVSLYANTRPHFEKLEELTDSMINEAGPKYDELKTIASKLNLLDLNRALYRCDQEERDMGKGSGAFDIPQFGPLVYCGTQGFVSLLTEIAPNNDLGHPFCGNLRDGNWMIGKEHQRLSQIMTLRQQSFLQITSSIVWQSIRTPRLCPDGSTRIHCH